MSVPRFRTRFARRLARLREDRGLSLADLARATGIPEGSLTYFEVHGGHPPDAWIALLADAFQVSTRQMLGLSPVEETLPRGAESVRLRRDLLRRVRLLSFLAHSDQEEVIGYIDGLLQRRGRKPPRRVARG